MICLNFGIIISISLTFIISNHSVKSDDMETIGVAKKDNHLYYSQDLKCPATGLKLTQEMINDGRCDCPDDGFDEPGTAACEKGRFYCKNTGYQMKYISSFKVNDGVCDCCDGSDEYLDLFSIKCPNNCAEVAKTIKRTKYLEKAKKKKAQKHYALSKSFAIKAQNDLKAKLDEINSKLAEINKKAETIPLELENESSSSDNIEIFLADYRLKLDQLEQLIANLTSSTQSTNEPSPSNVITNDLKESNPAADSKMNSWKNLIALKLRAAKEIISKFASVNVNKKPATIITKFLPTIVTKTIVQYDYKPTKTFDDKYNELDYEKDELVTQAQEIEESLKDSNYFGPDSVSLSLKEKCFSFESGEYVYSLCWFKEAKQENKNGSNQVLGKWGNWGSSTSGSSGNNFNYNQMIYTEGSYCGKKPRDASVQLECGWDDQIISVDEPSMCSYVIKFSTPLACVI